jgi:hypothetical protein
MSPMPTPRMMGRRHPDDDIDDLPPLSPRVSRNSVHRGNSIIRRSPSPTKEKRKKKSVTLYDEQAETDARDIAAELSRSHPNNRVLIDIMPTLSHDQVLELRTAYKRVPGPRYKHSKAYKIEDERQFLQNLLCDCPRPVGERGLLG